MEKNILPQLVNDLLFAEKRIWGMPHFGQLSVIGKNNIQAIIDQVKANESYLNPEQMEALEGESLSPATKLTINLMQEMFVASLVQLESQYETAVEKPVFPKLRNETFFVDQDLVIIDVDNRHGRQKNPEQVIVKAKFSQLRKNPPGYIEYTPVERGDNSQESYIIRPDSPELILESEFDYFHDYLLRSDFSDDEEQFYTIWKMNTGLNIGLLLRTS